MKSMFAPSECFKGAVAGFVISYLAFRYVYHHTGHYSLTGACVMTAVPVFFGIIGLLEGFGG